MQTGSDLTPRQKEIDAFIAEELAKPDKEEGNKKNIPKMDEPFSTRETISDILKNDEPDEYDKLMESLEMKPGEESYTEVPSYAELRKKPIDKLKKDAFSLNNRLFKLKEELNSIINKKIADKIIGKDRQSELQSNLKHVKVNPMKIQTMNQEEIIDLIIYQVISALKIEQMISEVLHYLNATRNLSKSTTSDREMDN